MTQKPLKELEVIQFLKYTDPDFTGEIASWFGFVFSCFGICSLIKNLKRVIDLLLYPLINLSISFCTFFFFFF